MILEGRKERPTEGDYWNNYERTFEGMTKEDLANTPIRYMLEQKQIWIDIGFDLKADDFKLKYLGIDVEVIRKLELSDKIHKHKFVDTSMRNLIRVQFHTIY